MIAKPMIQAVVASLLIGGLTLEASADRHRGRGNRNHWRQQARNQQCAPNWNQARYNNNCNPYQQQAQWQQWQQAQWQQAQWNQQNQWNQAQCRPQGFYAGQYYQQVAPNYYQGNNRCR